MKHISSPHDWYYFYGPVQGKKISNKMGSVSYDSSWTARVNYVEHTDIPYEENENTYADAEEVPVSHADES